MAEERPGSRVEVLRLWETTTGISLNPEQRQRFLTRPETVALMRMPTDYVVFAFQQSPKLIEALRLARERRSGSRGKVRTPKLRSALSPQWKFDESKDPEPERLESSSRSIPITGAFGQPIYRAGVCPFCLENDGDCFCG